MIVNQSFNNLAIQSLNQGLLSNSKALAIKGFCRHLLLNPTPSTATELVKTAFIILLHPDIGDRRNKK